MNNEITEIQNLENRISNIKLKNMASENEIKRLDEALENKKKEIKEIYGVEITDFSKAIDILKKELSVKMKELQDLIEKSEQKIGVKI